ncbi:MAG: hypothetical protein ACEQSB_06405 [Undibacterium sp.]
MQLPKQLEGQSIEMLADPEIQHSAYHLKWWGLALFSIKELDTFNQLFDAEILVPLDWMPVLPHRLACALNYVPMISTAHSLKKQYCPKNEGAFFTNLGKAFAIASASIDSSEVA